MAATALAAAAATDDATPKPFQPYLTTNAPSAASNATPSIEDLLPDVVVARGKGFEIKRSVLDQAVLNAKANAAAQGQQISAEQLPLLAKQALDDMILVNLLNGVATADQKAEGQREADTNYAEIKKKFPTEELMVRQLKTSGLTPEMLRARLAEQATAHAVLAARVNVTDAEIRKFYDDNPTMMQMDEKAVINFIAMGGPDAVTGAPLADDQKAAKKKQLEDLRDRARRGEDFAKLARDYSESTATRDNGGQITLAKGTQRVPPEFEAAAFALGTNEVSDVVTTPYGFYLIKMDELIPARKATLAEATPDIRRELEKQGIQKLLPQLFAQLKKDANVEILDPQLRDSEVPPAGQTGSVDMIPPDTKSAGGSK